MRRISFITLLIFTLTLTLSLSISYYELLPSVEQPINYWSIRDVLIGIYNFPQGTIMVFSKRINFIPSGEFHGDVLSRAKTLRMGRFSQALRVGDFIYVLTPDNLIYQLSFKGDNPTWKVIKLPIGGVHAFSIKGNYLAFRTRREVGLIALRPSPRLLWTANIGITLKGSPVLDSKNTLYVRDRYNRVYAVQGGQVRARFKFGRYVSNLVQREGKVLLCSSRGFFGLGTDSLPKVVISSDSPFYVSGTLKLRVIGGEYWCSSKVGVVAWNGAGQLVNSARLEPQKPYYSFFPAYSLRDKLAYRIRRKGLALQFFGPFVYLLSSFHDVIPTKEGTIYLRLDNWRLSFTFQERKGYRKLSVRNTKGVLITARVLPSGFSSFSSKVLYSLTEYDYTGDIYSSLLSVLGPEEPREVEMWKSLYFMTDRSKVRFFKVGEKIFLTFYSWPSGTIFVPIDFN